MTSDLRERFDPSESTEDATRTRVEWYFGDLVNTVSTEYPVTRPALVGTLATLESHARDQESLLRDRGDRLGDAHAPGQVLQVPLQVWSVLEETSDRDGEELRAARAVHRRMGVALTGEEPAPAAPFFVFAAESPA